MKSTINQKQTSRFAESHRIAFIWSIYLFLASRTRFRDITQFKLLQYRQWLGIHKSNENLPIKAKLS